MILPPNTTVVVADGHGATLFRNTAAQGIELVEQDKVTPQNLSDQGAGDSPQDRSPRDEDEATFAVQLTEHLNKLALGNKIDGIVIVADPTTLGTMRKHYHKMLEKVLLGDLAKNLTNSSIDEIAEALKA